ncbi:putative Zn finger protein [Methanococcus maripaludis]|uniref:Putative Zn finger protein n=1 Tax=Methanococcus maripaludis TaxID=39152 RepID=A0A7J9PTS3_METMI|nr:HVO_0476 family zinc finger protein [Methanococcus maripaludis]MBA2853751.1 putative Zn finger protein [Methanococcus maripaludis]MBA2869536.1 putative Zn finger protein [Methanococcus maripaludis]
MEDLYLECPSCDEVTLHNVLKEKESKKHLKVTVKCQECGTVHDIEKNFKLKDIKIVISRYDESEQSVLQIATDEVLKVEDVILAFDESVEITALETEDSRRVSSSAAQDLKMIWAKSVDVPKKVGISINSRESTYSFNILVPQDYVFEEKKIYRAGRDFFRIKQIKTEKGNFSRELARKIKRIYGEPVKPLRDYTDLTEYML